VNILIRALEDSGRAQVLSRPQIMALNNQLAFVQVGADIPRVLGTSQTTGGNVQTDVQDVPTGLILRIQPLINDDGIVVMNIDAERSFLDNAAASVDIGAGLTAQPIRRTTAQTTVSAKSGQTVVLAGLITKDKAVEERKVPWLGDVPVLGHLFRYDSTVEERRELLIVLTPQIVERDEDYEWLKVVESQRISWCLGDVVEIHGDVGLQGAGCIFCQQEVPVLFPHLNPFGIPCGMPCGGCSAGCGGCVDEMWEATPITPAEEQDYELEPTPMSAATPYSLPPLTDRLQPTGPPIRPANTPFAGLPEAPVHDAGAVRAASHQLPPESTQRLPATR
jgi:hypothetical protein